MRETIFFATFNTVVGTQIHSHDRREYFSSKRTLEGFHKWIEAQRVEIESSLQGESVVVNIQFIKLGYE